MPRPRTVVVDEDRDRRERAAGRSVARADVLDLGRVLADWRRDAPAERGEDRLVVGTVRPRYQSDTTGVEQNESNLQRAFVKRA